MNVNLLTIPQLHQQIAISTHNINNLQQLAILMPNEQLFPQVIIQILHQINQWTSWRDQCQARLLQLI